MDYTKRTWTSLSQLKEHIVRDGKERILDFTGNEIVTNKYRYGLYDGMLTRNPTKKLK